MMDWRIAMRRGTTAAATVQYCGRSSSKALALSVAFAGSRGVLAAMDRRRMVDWRIELRRGKRGGMLAWTTKKRDNDLRRR